MSFLSIQGVFWSFFCLHFIWCFVKKMDAKNRSTLYFQGKVCFKNGFKESDKNRTTPIFRAKFASKMAWKRATAIVPPDFQGKVCFWHPVILIAQTFWLGKTFLIAKNVWLSRIPEKFVSESPKSRYLSLFFIFCLCEGFDISKSWLQKNFLIAKNFPDSKKVLIVKSFFERERLFLTSAKVDCWSNFLKGKFFPKVFIWHQQNLIGARSWKYK